MVPPLITKRLLDNFDVRTFKLSGHEGIALLLHNQFITDGHYSIWPFKEQKRTGIGRYGKPVFLLMDKFSKGQEWLIKSNKHHAFDASGIDHDENNESQSN